MSSRLRIALVALGVLLIAATPVAWSLTQPDSTAGELPSALQVESEIDETSPDAESEASSPSTEAPEETAEQAASSEGSDANQGTSTAIEPRPQRPPRPVGVSLPALGVQDATVVQVGLDANGAVDIPENVREVGWYSRGPRPGEAGNAFMTSHVDSRVQGPGVLFNLSQSQPGDLIEVLHEDGTTTEWEVVFKERIVKGSYPFDRVFRFEGQPGLVIDTCGGRFDRSTGNYENIDIIYAVPSGEEIQSSDSSASSTGD